MMSEMKVLGLQNMTAAKDHVNPFLKSVAWFSVDVSAVQPFELRVFEGQKRFQVSG